MGGNRPQDIIVHDPRFYGKILKRGSLGLGESYMAGWWDSDAVDEFIHRILAARLYRFAWLNPSAILEYLDGLIKNQASAKHAFEVGEEHYDLGNDLFEYMLGPSMTYTCAVWNQETVTLEDAQRAKLRLVCTKLNFKPGQRILDIGCGWGSFAKFAAEEYGVSVVGTTVAKEQAEYARKFCANLPVEFRVEDYRDTHGSFDHVVSVGMFEHVERKGHRAFFEAVKRCLLPGGMFLLHTMGKKSGGGTRDPWIHKYIFPSGMIPVQNDINSGIEGLFGIEDWHWLGSDNYDRTLMAWHKNFSASWPKLASFYGNKVNGTFERMWRYYLLSFAGAFRAKEFDIWQIKMKHL